MQFVFITLLCTFVLSIYRFTSRDRNNISKMVDKYIRVIIFGDLLPWMLQQWNSCPICVQFTIFIIPPYRVNSRKHSRFLLILTLTSGPKSNQSIYPQANNGLRKWDRNFSNWTFEKSSSRTIPNPTSKTHATIPTCKLTKAFIRKN